MAGFIFQKEPGGKVLKTINLFIPESGLASLNSNLPHSGSNYVKGRLYHGEKLLKVKIKYRGDMVYHFGYYKKSMRVKTKKGTLFNGMRSFNLITLKSAEQIRNYLSYKLASTMGLIVPKAEIVNVAINGKNQGLYLLVEQLNENMLRKQKLMPGDLYKGELVAKDTYEGAATRSLFDHPSLWGKASFNNHYKEDSLRPLEHLIKTVNLCGSNIEIEWVAGCRDVGKYMDMQSWGIFNAFEIMTQSYHYDDMHNWRLYYDPARGRFFPIVWDPAGWAPFWLPEKGKISNLNISTTRLHRALQSNGDFIRARQEAIDNFFKKGTDKIFLTKVKETIESIEPYIYADPNLTIRTFEEGSYAEDPEDVISSMYTLKKSIKKTFNDVASGYIYQKGKVFYSEFGNGQTISISIKGLRPIEKLLLKYSRPLQNPTTVKIRYVVMDKTKEVDITSSVIQKGSKIEISTNLLAQHGISKQNIPAYYELELSGITTQNRLIGLQTIRGGVIEGATYLKELEITPFGAMEKVVDFKPLTKPTVWDGDIVIDGIKEIDNQLIIRAGSTIKLQSGAGIIFNSKLIAEGTLEKPIRFVPADKGQEPWGAIVLKGEGADKSVVNHCIFEGGSGFKGDLFEYSAMLSVHDVSGVMVINSEFSNSRLTDDMVHAVYSDIIFKNTTFERSFADALDLDISSATIENCHFSNSGNDAIDLMTSRVTLIDNLIENSGDKGISVGEGSHLLGINNRLKGNMFGVQSKDSSIVVLYNVDLSDNNQALDAYKKNWRYGGGGKIFLYKGRLTNNKKEVNADKKSLIWLYDSYTDKNIETKKHRIQVHDTVDSFNNEDATEKDLWRFPEEIAALGDMKKNIWIKANPSRRGASNVAH